MVKVDMQPDSHIDYIVIGGVAFPFDVFFGTPMDDGDECDDQQI